MGERIDMIPALSPSLSIGHALVPRDQPGESDQCRGVDTGWCAHRYDLRAHPSLWNGKSAAIPGRWTFNGAAAAEWSKEHLLLSHPKQRQKEQEEREKGARGKKMSQLPNAKTPTAQQNFFYGGTSFSALTEASEKVTVLSQNGKYKDGHSDALFYWI